MISAPCTCIIINDGIRNISRQYYTGTLYIHVCIRRLNIIKVRSGGGVGWGGRSLHYIKNIPFFLLICLNNKMLFFGDSLIRASMKVASYHWKQIHIHMPKKKKFIINFPLLFVCHVHFENWFYVRYIKCLK